MSAFRPGQKAGHCLINNSGATCRYVIVGERNPNEVAVYTDSKPMKRTLRPAKSVCKTASSSLRRTCKARTTCLADSLGVMFCALGASTRMTRVGSVFS